MCDLTNFLKNLFLHLTKHETDLQTNIIRVHSRKLNVLGDLSFPLSSKPWKAYTQNLSNDNILLDENSTKNLKAASSNWFLKINRISVGGENVLVFLDRASTFKLVIRNVLQTGDKYGSENFSNSKLLEITTDNSVIRTLTDLKVHLIKSILQNFSKFISSSNDDNTTFTKILITQNNKFNNSELPTILVGAVLNERGTKDTSTTPEQLYRKRTVDMRLLAEHKYGLRVTSHTEWKEIFENLGKAAVTIYLLQNKPQHTNVVKLSDSSGDNVRGASFILYNCARISTLLKKFDEQVANGVYTSLPDLLEMSFDLLEEPEEWELLFVYILQFPRIIENCLKDVDNGRANPHYLISHLMNLASVFSVYYRRVKILMEPRDYLFPVIFQRIYLIKALQQIIFTSLKLLDIEPVSQM